uniref:Immunoglobulin light chain variable region n=1 Tax=Sus scrofa TaxID=9823 RepID=UPI003624ACE0
QTVIQEPAMSVSLGGTVTLTCGFISGSVTGTNYPSWFQQTPGQPPRLLIYYANSRPTEVPSRFSGAISGNKAALTITGAQAEDEADYFCCLYKTNNNILFGGGTHLTVL